MGLFILIYLDVLFLVFRMFILGIKIFLKSEMWRGEDGLDFIEFYLLIDMDGCFVFGRESVKFFFLSLVCGGVVCVFVFGMVKGI